SPLFHLSHSPGDDMSHIPTPFALNSSSLNCTVLSGSFPSTWAIVYELGHHAGPLASHTTIQHSGTRVTNISLPCADMLFIRAWAFCAHSNGVCPSTSRTYSQVLTIVTLPLIADSQSGIPSRQSSTALQSGTRE